MSAPRPFPQFAQHGTALVACLALVTACTPGEGPSGSAGHPQEISVEVTSDPFHVDRIFKSMRGPLTTRSVVVGDTFEPELVWLTGYTVATLDAEDQSPDSMDFLCHSNLDWSRDTRPRWAARPRHRIFVLTQGQTDVRLPEGFGLPMLSNERLVFNSQVLNLNQPEIDHEVLHRGQIRYVRDVDVETPMQPLVFAGLQGLVTLEDEAEVWNMDHPDEVVEGASCALGDHAQERETNVLTDGRGKRFSPHWVVPPGHHVYRTLVTEQLALPYDTTIHYIGVHVHPHSQSLELRDLTAGETLFKSVQRNHTDRLGLESIESFSSREGIPIYKAHQYELVSVYHNPADRDGDAMAGMYVYYLDKKFDSRTAGAQLARHASE